jgi:hypothetical protein
MLIELKKYTGERLEQSPVTNSMVIGQQFNT